MFRFTRRAALTLAGACGALILGAGCEAGFNVLDGGVVTVQVVNDTDFEVDPSMVTTDDPDGFGLFNPGDGLATGLLAPGDVLEFTFDCDRLAAIRSDAAELLDDNGDPIIGAQPTSAIERGAEFECGDVIRFRFVGDERSFGILVSVNDAIVTSS